MAFRFQDHARRRAVAAGLVGVSLVTLFGPLLVVPAIALVALVYYSHQIAAVMSGDLDVPYPSLAFVIVVNAAIILVVQALVFVEGLRAA